MRRGRAVQVDPVRPTLKAPRTKRLKLKYDELLSNVSFNFNLRRYTEGYNGEGFAYFPGTGAESGKELIFTKAIPGCKPGPHSVRLRYLTSQANGVKLDVLQTSNPTAPAKVGQCRLTLPDPR